MENNNMTAISKFQYGCTCFTLKQIEEELGLKKIYIISTQSIERENDDFNDLIKTVEDKCLGKHVWALFGSNGDDQWITLQVATISARGKDIRREIKIDFNRMLPFSQEHDIRAWKSYFHGTVMKVEEGHDVICQKYRKIKSLCSILMITILEKENELKEIELSDISKYQKFEIDLAKKTKPFLWNPSPKEKKYL